MPFELQCTVIDVETQRPESPGRVRFSLLEVVRSRADFWPVDAPNSIARWRVRRRLGKLPSCSYSGREDLVLILKLLVLCRLRTAKDTTRGTSTVLDSVLLQVQAVLHRACRSIRARSIKVLRPLSVLLPAGSVGEGVLEAEHAGSEEDRLDEVEEVLEEGTLDDLRNFSLRTTRPS